MSNTWLDTLNRVVEDLFNQSAPLPAHLQAELHLLLEWNHQTHILVDRIFRMQAQVRRWRYAREDAEARAAAIAERQRLEVEREMLARKLARWRRQLDHARAEIDRVTDKILAELRQRQASPSLPQETPAHKNAEDALYWELFKARLETSKPLFDFDLDALAEAVKKDAAEQARLAEEYARLQARPLPSAEDNAAAWTEFTQLFGDEG